MRCGGYSIFTLVPDFTSINIYPFRVIFLYSMYLFPEALCWYGTERTGRKGDYGTGFGTMSRSLYGTERPVRYGVRRRMFTYRHEDQYGEG